MTESPRERKKSDEELIELTPVPEWTQCGSKDDYQRRTKLQTIAQFNAQEGSCAQAVCSQQIHKVCRCEVQVYVFEAKKRCKNTATNEHGRLLSQQHDRKYEQTVKEAVILEVDRNSLVQRPVQDQIGD